MLLVSLLDCARAVSSSALWDSVCIVRLGDWGLDCGGAGGDDDDDDDGDDNDDDDIVP